MYSVIKQFEQVDSDSMKTVAAAIIPLLGEDSLVSLEGELGAGKTTLVQHILAQMGYQGRVKSPTYTIIEQYHAGGKKLVHIDLYRVSDAEELEYLALDDFFAQPCIKFIEWYQQAQGCLPSPDLVIGLQYQGSGRKVVISRKT